MTTLNDLASIINKIDWAKAYDFKVILQPVDDSFNKIIHWGNNNETQKTIDICLKNVALPQYTGNFEEVITAGIWHFARTSDPIFSTTLTFRDISGGSLYRKFLNAFEQGPKNYQNKTAFQLIISLNSKEGYIEVFNVRDAQVASVSNLSLSHETTEILEFDVEFKSNRPTHDSENVRNISVNPEKSSSGNIKKDLANKAVGLFSGLLKNGLNKTQDTILNNYKKVLDSW